MDDGQGVCMVRGWMTGRGGWIKDIRVELTVNELVAGHPNARTVYRAAMNIVTPPLSLSPTPTTASTATLTVSPTSPPT